MKLHMDKKHRPFSTGSQWADWSMRNCGSCKKGFDMKRGKFRCDHHLAVALAYCTDGQVTEEVAKAIGYLDNKDCYIWECPEWARS